MVSAGFLWTLKSFNAGKTKNHAYVSVTDIFESSWQCQAHTCTCSQILARDFQAMYTHVFMFVIFITAQLTPSSYRNRTKKRHLTHMYVHQSNPLGSSWHCVYTMHLHAEYALLHKELSAWEFLALYMHTSMSLLFNPVSHSTTDYHQLATLTRTHTRTHTHTHACTHTQTNKHTNTHTHTHNITVH